MLAQVKGTGPDGFLVAGKIEDGTFERSSGLFLSVVLIAVIFVKGFRTDLSQVRGDR